jgi:amino acid transporter
MTTDQREKIGFWEVTAIGIGGMVGGGIFAVLGLSVHLAGGGAPLAFLLAGVVALVTSYSYVKLSVTFPSQGGTVAFIDRAFVILLYVLVAMVAVGTLSVADIVDAKDYALAEAARPFLGQAGFVLIAIAAMLSTASALNATVYGSARLSYVIAKDGELPSVLEHKAWGEPVGGLLITTGAALLIANGTDLSSMSTMGSAGFLIIFAVVNAANVKLSTDTHSKRWLSVAGAVLCLAALASLLWQTASTSPRQLLVLLAMIGAAIAIETAFRIATGRSIHLPKPPHRGRQ